MEPARIDWGRLRPLAEGRLSVAASILCQHRFSRFILVGGLNTAVGYSLLLVALVIMPTTFSALALANILAILFNFMTTGSLVFGARDSRQLPRFLGVYGAVFVYNSVGLTLLEGMGVRAWLGALVLLPSAVVISYLLNQRFVFKAPSDLDYQSGGE
jgi:putative flippase GtrA